MWQPSSLDIKKYYLALAIFVVISSVQCQNRPNVEPQRVEKTEGEPVDILCSFGKPIERCRFEKSGGISLKLNPAIQRKDNFQYYGEGLEKGHCGLSILQLTRELEGNWTCVLDMGVEFDDVIGNTEILIARAPQQPQLDVQEINNLREGENLLAECSFRDGKPSAAVYWFLGDEEITTHEEVIKTDNNGYDVISSRIQRLLRADDNLKSLICRVQHPAFDVGFTNTSTQVHVNYQPQALSRNELYINGLTIGSSADIAITIRSNPRPTLRWTIDGKNYNEGTQNERFVVKNAEQTDDGRWLAKLTIVQLTQEDTLKTYELNAFNSVGSQVYPIRIGGSPDENASGLGIVAIIAIAIAALVALVIISLLVVARITKRWCFAGASMHPNGPDSEAQIAPDEDKIHEQYEPHNKVSDEESADVEPTKAANGKSNGNTSV